MAKISVIIPVYNAEKYLESCVSSVLSQTETDLEVILIDDGSRDGSATLCDAFAAKDCRVKVIHKENGGVSAARNDGLAAASGKYIAFVDSDDRVEPETYAAMLEAAEKYSCDVVMCDAVKEFADHTELFSQSIRDGYYDREQLRNEYFPRLLMQSDLTYPPATSNWLLLVKKSLICENHLSYPLGVRISEDLFFGAQVMYRAGSLCYLKGKNFYRYNVGNLSSSTKKADPLLWDNYERLLGRLHEAFGELSDYDFSVQLSHAAIFFALNTIGQTAGYAMNDVEKKKIVYKIVTSGYVKQALSYANSLTVPRKLRFEVSMLRRKATANMLMRYLIYKNTKGM